MAGRKDFTVNAGKVYGAIAEATADPEQEVQHERKTYTEEEAQKFLAEMKTAGRKGIKLPRINMAFSPELYDYIRTMAKASGLSFTEFVNRVIYQHMTEHREQYDRAVEFRNSL